MRHPHIEAFSPWFWSIVGTRFDVSRRHGGNLMPLLFCTVMGGGRAPD
jgi:hypothetical protein